MFDGYVRKYYVTLLSSQKPYVLTTFWVSFHVVATAASTLQASTQAFVPRRQHLLHIMPSSSVKEGVLTNDISNNVVNHDNDDEDARAYHELVSAAVDYTHIYERNGLVTAIRTTRDIDTNSRRSFLYNIPLLRSSSTPPPQSLFMLPPPIEVPTKIKARIPSPSGFKIAILVEEILPSSSSSSTTTTTGLVENKRFVFEIWTNYGQCLTNRIVLPTTTTHHGPICCDFAWFGGISWNPDENILIYTAQVNNCKTTSFFTTPKATTTTPTTTATTTSIDEAAVVVVVGGQHVLGVGKSEDWGEKYTTMSLLGLYCINIITGKVGRVTNVPGYTHFSTIGSYVLGQPIFTPCGSSIVYTAWDAGGGDNMPRRLGAIYCYHRACKLYTSSVTKLLHQLATNTNNDDDDDVSVGKDTERD